MPPLGLSLGLGLFARKSLSGEESPPDTSQTLFNHTTQIGMTAASDSDDYTLGVAFTTLVPGTITEVHIYNASSGAQATRDAGIWDINGNLIETGSISGEAAGPRWVTVPLDTPVSIAADTLHVVGVLVTLNSSYSAEAFRFTTEGIISGDIHAWSQPDITPFPSNGRLNAGSSLAFPNGTFNDANYWVDLTFIPD